MSGVAGISTVGVKVGYAVETTAGTKPTKFKQLHRINATDDIGIDTETIDASALEDEQAKKVCELMCEFTEQATRGLAR